MTVYVVPCGLSIQEGLSRGRHGGTTARELFGKADAFTGRLRAGEFPADAVVPQWWRTLGGSAIEADPSRWHADICAEMSTLAHRADVVDVDRLLSRGNRVMLLASDTSAGLASALLVASRLARLRDDSELHRIAYAETGPSRLTCDLAPGTVTVVRVSGLAADATDGLVRGAAGLGAAMRAARDAANKNEPLEVHLTGGLKATLLHMLSLAELALSMGGPTVSAWYRPEGDDAKTARIGLRRFTGEYVECLRRELTLADRGEFPPPMSVSVQEAAWDLVHGRPRLNGFGRAYLALLGPADIASSDEGG